MSSVSTTMPLFNPANLTDPLTKQAAFQQPLFAKTLDALAEAELLEQVAIIAVTWLFLYCVVLAGLVAKDNSPFGPKGVGATLQLSSTQHGEKFVLAQNLVSTWHAIVSAALGFVTFAYTEPTCSVVRTDWTRFAMANTTGYLVSHLITMSFLHVAKLRKLDAAAVFHHLFSITWFSSGLHYNIAIWFGSTLLFNEASTPFVNLFEYLVANDMKASKLFAVNGLLLTLSFFLCRMVYIPYSFYQYAFLCDFCREELGVFAHMATFGYAVMFALNSLWFSKMVKGVVSTVKKMLKPKAA